MATRLLPGQESWSSSSIIDSKFAQMFQAKAYEIHFLHIA